ncbi:exodeoxyribonuclease VII large subunit, partial [Mesorhizobium sp. M8A.F.Ca.ET.173.01.1.1]
VASYYKFKTPTLLYDQQIQKRDDLEKQLNLSINFKVNQQVQKLQLIKQNFNLKHFKQSIQREQATINQQQTNLVKLMNHLIVKQRNNLTNKIENLNNLSPTNTMLRGYTIVNKEDRIVT